MPNPFKPSFGVSPPLLAGRDELIQDFMDAFGDGPGAGGRATLYTGARGAGKTVMLNAVEDEVRQQGWLVVSETATPGIVGRLQQSRLPELLRDFDPAAVRRRMTGITGPLSSGGITWETLEPHVAKADLRSQITLLTDLLAENETGLMLTLDEIHQSQIDELREIAAVVQHAFREERELVFVAAGLSSSVSDLLSDDVLTFLRRAERHHIGPVEFDEARRALRDPIVDAGRKVGADALDVMAEGTLGYPFLIQLVGSHCWRENQSSDEITVADAEAGVASAGRRLGTLVHAPALADISQVDKTFLLAMAEDDERSKMADIIDRLGRDKSYANRYRSRLIDAELIVAAGHGYVDFALPGLRAYLREHVADDL